jgi:cell division septum initiation protein DivIVA
MAEIINIPNLGEARLPLNEYDKMRDRIRELEEENKRLTEMLDHVCDENKVRVRRQIIRECYPSTNPRAITQREVIEDKLVNMQDITDELDEKLRALEKEYKEKCEEMESENKRISKALEQCQRMKIDLEIEVDRLKQRGWWARLWNK